MRLNNLDLVVALHLLNGDAPYLRLSEDLGVSTSQLHSAVRRLQQAQLLRPESRDVNRLAFEEFLIHGARYVFPPVLGSRKRGVPTAHAAPALASIFGTADPYVWPSAQGEMVGEALQPLYAGAPQLRERAPETYRLLTLFDALRVGQAREKNVARQLLKDAIRTPAIAA